MNTVWQIALTYGHSTFFIPNAVTVFSNCYWCASHGTKQLGMILPSLIYSYNIKSILEIGLANGFLTQLLARGLAANGGGKLISCDITEDAIPLCKNFSVDVPIEHITLA